MSDKLEFTERQLQLANLGLQIENNAFLRLLLANQVKIMDKLEIDVKLPTSAYADIMPGTVADDNGEMAVYIEAVDTIAHLIQKKAWEWAQMNDRNSQ